MYDDLGIVKLCSPVDMRLCVDINPQKTTTKMKIFFSSMKTIRYLSHTTRLLAKSTSTPKVLGRASNNLSVGLVGLANVGKSTFSKHLQNRP